MREDIEPARRDRLAHPFCDTGRIEAVRERGSISLVALGVAAVHIGRNRPAEMRRAIAAIVEHAGLDPAWAENADADQAAGQFRGQHLGYPDRGKLGRAIGPRERRAGYPIHRSRVDDVAFLAMRLHMRKEDLQAVNKPLKIDADDPIPVRCGDAYDRTRPRYAGIVAEDVDVAERRKGLCRLDVGDCDVHAAPTEGPA